MKWQLTARYLLSILIIVGIVLVLNTVILIALLLNQSNSGLEDVTSQSGEDFTRSFSQYLTMENGKPTVSTEGLSILEQSQAWIQILDRNGTVVHAELTPLDTPLHYAPVDLIQAYKYTDAQHTVHFVSNYKDYSYLIGFQNSDEQRYVMMFNSSSVVQYISKALLVIILVDLFIAALIGLLFSTILTRPVSSLIERVTQLKTRDFSVQAPKRTGIYKPVFENLNTVSETLQAQEEERLKLEKMRAEWVSNVSHDIKTPLASIQGYAELLRDTNVSHQERLDYAEVIERKSIYMKELLDDFNLTMRLRNADLPLALQETEMNHFMRELVIDLLNDPQFGYESLTFEPAADTVMWVVDQHLMKRALLNFIYNAFIHNDPPVDVTITVMTESIQIADNGKGIAEQDLAQIFERYYRGADTENIRGTGLGTAISRDIIEAHKGQVTISSELRKGTVVEIWMQKTE